MEIYTVYELSEKLRMSLRGVRGLISTGSLRGRKIGRAYYVTERSLVNFIDGVDEDKASNRCQNNG